MFLTCELERKGSMSIYKQGLYISFSNNTKKIKFFSTILVNLFFLLPYFHNIWHYNPSSGLLFPTSNSLWKKNHNHEETSPCFVQTDASSIFEMLSNCYFFFSPLDLVHLVLRTTNLSTVLQDLRKQMKPLLRGSS